MLQEGAQIEPVVTASITEGLTSALARLGTAATAISAWVDAGRPGVLDPAHIQAAAAAEV